MWNSKRLIPLFFFFAFLISSQQSLISAEEFIYSLEGERDPFEPLITPEGLVNLKLLKEVETLELNGILYSGEDSVAIINNIPLKKGIRIGSYKVIEIKPKEVILKKGKKELILKLGGEDEE